MIRITGGEFRGRSLQTPPEAQTRPTQAKLRQALFNSLQTVIDQASVLEFFAGSGALSFEALSRGALHSVMVESARSAAKVIARNANDLGVTDRITLLCEDFARCLPHVAMRAPYDLVLADPPYAQGFEIRILEDCPWDQLLAVDGRLCLEWSAVKSKIETLPDRTGFLVKIREKNYGDSMLTTYARIAE